MTIGGVKLADKSILIVDDDPVYAKMVREWTKETYQAFVVVSGEQTLRFLTKHSVDMILLDYEMPGMSGTETLDHIRENDETKDIPVTILSGTTDESTIAKIMELDTSGFLRKTIKKEELLDYLRENIG